MNERHDLAADRVTPERLLGKYEVAVHRHFEYAARRGNQLDVGIGDLPLQLSRQTGGSGLVISDDAILDGDPHARLRASRGRASES
jgi:hypothetical protein